MKRAILFFILSSVGIVQAQNRILVLKPGENINQKVKLDKSEDPGNHNFEYNFGPAPQGVVSGIPIRIDYTNAVNGSVSWFQTWHLRMGRIDAGRDFLDSGYEWYHDDSTAAMMP